MPRLRSFPGWGLLVALLLMLWSKTVTAEPVRPKEPIFVTGEQLAVLGFAPLSIDVEDYRLQSVRSEGTWQLLSELQRFGYNAKVVPHQGTVQTVDFLLSGAITDFRCISEEGETCGIEISWQLLNTRTQQVVYKLVARHEEKQLDNLTSEDGGVALLVGALDSLLARQQFSGALRATVSLPHSEAPRGSVSEGMGPCELRVLSLPSDATEVESALLMVTTAQGEGMASFVSEDGYFVTAAHLLLSDTFEVTLPDATQHAAELVRVDTKRDVALARLVDREHKTACFRWSAESPEPHQTFFVAGISREGGTELVESRLVGQATLFDAQFFKLELETPERFQGAPVLDQSGFVRGVLSGNITGDRQSHVRYSVPAKQAISALVMRRRPTRGAGSSAAAGQTPAVQAEARLVGSVEDEPDPDWEYVWDGTRKKRPGWVKPVRTVGWIMFGGGALLVVGGASNADSGSVAGYVAAGSVLALGGLGLVATSYVAGRPKSSSTEEETARRDRPRLGVIPTAHASGGGVMLFGAF